MLADSAAASLLAAGQVDMVLTGADRIAADGSVANKVGTYGLAVLARHHRVPFVVVAPVSTIDFGTPPARPASRSSSGPAQEVTTLAGPAGRAGRAAPAYNPAFDVTPPGLVTALVTERGIAQPVNSGYSASAGRRPCTAGTAHTDRFRGTMRTMKGRVLVVDDDAALAEMLGIVLRGEGFEPTFVADGDKALEAFRETRPDLVLLDLMLPGMDGIDVCRQIRAESGVPIVMLTAKSDTVDVVLGPGVRRRRLHRQAVQVQGADRPGPGPAAPDRRPGAGDAADRRRRRSTWPGTR